MRTTEWWKLLIVKSFVLGLIFSAIFYFLASIMLWSLLSLKETVGCVAISMVLAFLMLDPRTNRLLGLTEA